MAELDTTESVWARGWRDIKKGLHSPWFWIAEVFVAGAVGVAINPWLGLLAVAAGVFILWIGATAGAPFRQRNEARQRVAELEDERKPKVRLTAIKIHDANGERFVRVQMENCSHTAIVGGLAYLEEMTLPPEGSFRADPGSLDS